MKKDQGTGVWLGHLAGIGLGAVALIVVTQMIGGMVGGMLLGAMSGLMP
ncbi:MAG: hypothetical protein LBJ02_12600 [Bifidobacteriaceae bacterium]|jgi:hypothetical protein|nr:hypothetical protein [Bifidobacteriaceae bacterium]